MWLAVAVLFALRVPFLPTTLEDIDSVNFDLGVHDFDPLRHQPHPPGYAIFIAAAKLVHPFFASHAGGIGFVSAVFGALTLIPLLLLMRAVAGRVAGALATVIVLFNPLVWLNSVRPMSDTTGLFAVVSAQALLVLAIQRRDSDGEQADRLWRWGALIAGLALGIRVQAIVLVGPVLLYGWWQRRSLWHGTTLYFSIGIALWLIPLIALSGGPIRLWNGFVELVLHAVPVEPLLSRLTVDRASAAARSSFVVAWGPTWLAVTMLALAGLGAALVFSQDRRRLALIAVLFLPYASYHYLLQMTEVLRYAIPIVPLVAVLAVEPLVRWRQWLGVPLPLAGAAFIGAASFITLPALHAYSTTPSPMAQAIAGVRERVAALPDAIVSGHYMFNRYLAWLPEEVRVLRPKPRVEWRQLAEYWKGGGRQPILFLRDTMRPSLRLVSRRSQKSLNSYRWPPVLQHFLDGALPSRIELIQIDPPRWFAESGFFLSEEAGLMNDVASEAHRLLVSAGHQPQTVLLSGSVPGKAPVPVTLRIGERAVQQWVFDGQFTVQADLDAFPPKGYVPVTLEAAAPVIFSAVQLEEAEHGSVRPSAGFHHPERDERAVLFRWMGPEARAVVVLRRQRARLRLRGQVPIEYYELPVTVSLWIDEQTLATVVIGSKEFVLEHDLPPDVTGRPRTLRLHTSHYFVPNDVERNGDRRQLSLRVYELVLDSTGTSGG